MKYVVSERGGFQLMQILDLLGMYFDAAVVFVTSQKLLFRLALAILGTQNCLELSKSSMAANFSLKAFSVLFLINTTYLHPKIHNIFFKLSDTVTDGRLDLMSHVGVTIDLSHANMGFLKRKIHLSFFGLDFTFQKSHVCMAQINGDANV